MLNKSLAAHRIYDLHETSGFRQNDEEYRYYEDIAFEVYKLIESKFIPKDKHMEYDRLFFEYDLAIESAMLVFAQETWRQGIRDGIELSKVLKNN
jgi:hypothetical protein